MKMRRKGRPSIRYLRNSFYVARTRRQTGCPLLTHAFGLVPTWLQPLPSSGSGSGWAGWIVRSPAAGRYADNAAYLRQAKTKQTN